jgi:hypothetical protein
VRVIRLPKEATKHGDCVHRIWFTPDHRQLVVLLGHGEGAVALGWLDFASGGLIELLRVSGEAHGCAAPSPEFSADHRYLTYPFEDSLKGEIAVVDRTRPKAQVVLEGPRGPVLHEHYSHVTFSPDGRFLIGAGPMRGHDPVWPIHRWATAQALTAKQQRVRPVPDTEIRCRSLSPLGVAVSPEGRYLATVTRELIVVWDFASGELLAELELPAGAPTNGTVYDQLLQFSPDGRVLIVGGAALAAIDVASWELREFDTDTECCGLAMHPDSRLVATVNRSEDVRIWDLATGEMKSLQCPETSLFGCLAMAADGSSVVAGGEDGCLVQWDLQPAQRVTPTIAAAEPTPSGKIQHDVFGEIEYDANEEAWIGRHTLPVFAQYGRSLPRDFNGVEEPSPEFLQGIFPVQIKDPRQAGPSTAQVNAFRYFLDREAEVCRTVMEQVLKAHHAVCHGHLDWLVTWLRNYRESRVWGWLAQFLRPECKTTADLPNFVRCKHVEISRLKSGEYAYIAFQFVTIWYEFDLNDEGEGLSVVYHPINKAFWGDGGAVYEVTDAENWDEIDAA